MVRGAEAVRDVDHAAGVDPDRLTELASELVRFPSFSGQERDCADWLAGYLADAGLEVELVEAEPGRPNVVGRIPGDGTGPSLMFNGHLDVDPVPAGRTDPWQPRLVDGRLHGHGLFNMKAGVASMVHAAEVLARSGLRPRGDLIVAAVVGELQSGVGTASLIDAGTVPALAVVPEPSNMNIRTVHAGVLPLLLVTRGRAGWAGSAAELGLVNAVEAMARVVTGLSGFSLEFRSHPELPRLPQHVIGTVVGGLGEKPDLWRTAYVPDRCYATMHVRLPPHAEPAEAVAQVEAALDQVRGTHPDIDVSVLAPPASYRDPWWTGRHFMPGIDLPVDHPLVTAVASHYVDVVGREPARIGAETPGSYAGTDAGHLTAAGTAALVFGPCGHLHGEDYVEVERLVAHCRILCRLGAEVATSDFDRFTPSRP